MGCLYCAWLMGSFPTGSNKNCTGKRSNNSDTVMISLYQYDNIMIMILGHHYINYFFESLVTCVIKPILPDIRNRQTPLLAVRDSCSIGRGICFGRPCLFPPEKLGSPAASAKFGIWEIPFCITFKSVPGDSFFFLSLSRGRKPEIPE